MNETNNTTLRASRLPEVWPGWETVDKLGSGSFGAVYKICRQTGSFTEYAAVKHISIPKEPSEIEELRRNGYDDESITRNFREQGDRLLQEYALMRSLNGNTNIVNCDDVRSVPHGDGFGTDLYIKMELLSPLDKPEPARFDEKEIIRLGCNLCTALELCEKNNIIHRDIKPANIFVSANGDYKLGDFGVSRIMENSSTNGGITGTPRYMAPEVYANRKYGRTADIYSLGLVLYWLLNERRTPFQPLPPAKLSYGGDQDALNRRMKGEAIPAPKNGSEGLKRIVLKAVSYDPKERYQTASEMKKALEKLNEPAPPPPPPKPKWWIAAIPALALVLLFVSREKPEPPEPTPVVTVTPEPTPEPSPTPTPHIHDWIAATCTDPKTCSVCGETEGDPLGHSWVAATCTDPKTCSVCEMTEGDPLGHDWSPATCTRPAKCAICGKEQGSALGHTWVTSGYGQARACSVCGAKEPVTYSHSSDSPVDYFTENKSYTHRYAVSAAHTRKLPGSKKIVQNLREVGYNAYVYEIPNRTGYAILIGVFDKKEDAEDLAVHLRKLTVIDADLGSAYVYDVYLGSSAVSSYSNYQW